MGIYIAIVALFVAVACLAIALYKEHNEKARISYERDEFGHDLEYFQKVCADAERTETRLRSNMHRQQQVLEDIRRERDNALTVLEEKLFKNVEKYKTPDRVMTQIGREGVYYQFNWDPPEQHPEPIPITGSGTT